MGIFSSISTKWFFVHCFRESNPGHTDGRRALSPLRHPCSPKALVAQKSIIFTNISHCTVQLLFIYVSLFYPRTDNCEQEAWVQGK